MAVVESRGGSSGGDRRRLADAWCLVVGDGCFNSESLVVVATMEVPRAYWLSVIYMLL